MSTIFFVIIKATIGSFFFGENMNSYEVGHVIYLLQQKTLNILPAIIVEEIVRKTLEGKTTIEPLGLISLHS